MKAENVLVEFFVKVRDAAAEALDQLAPSEVKEREKNAVSESSFDLNFTEYTSPKLGTYAVAEEKGNPPEKGNRALSTLKQANATISNRYRGEHYQSAYWIYQDRIFKKALKTT